MSQRKPPSQRPERQSSRTVLLGVVPAEDSGPTRIGVLIRTTTGGNNSDTVILPDEARSLAADEADSRVKADLVRYADKAEETLPVLKDRGGNGVALVDAKVVGPEALKWWTERYRQVFRDAYQAALDTGWQSDIYLMATPTSESLDDPPDEISPVARSNRGFITRAIQGIRGSLDQVAPPGMFYVVATKESGRFSGTFVGLLPIVGREGLFYIVNSPSQPPRQLGLSVGPMCHPL